MINANDLGKDYVKDAIMFAAESQRWREKYYAEYKRNIDLSDAMTNMLFCFRCLTTDGGWDTMTDVEKSTMMKQDKFGLMRKNE